jgi:hypothetical protein
MLGALFATDVRFSPKAAYLADIRGRLKSAKIGHSTHLDYLVMSQQVK